MRYLLRSRSIQVIGEIDMNELRKQVQSLLDNFKFKKRPYIIAEPNHIRVFSDFIEDNERIEEILRRKFRMLGNNVQGYNVYSSLEPDHSKEELLKRKEYLQQKIQDAQKEMSKMKDRRLQLISLIDVAGREIGWINSRLDHL
jgi:DNA-binding transcriptional MerR regulator